MTIFSHFNSNVITDIAMKEKTFIATELVFKASFGANSSITCYSGKDSEFPTHCRVSNNFNDVVSHTIIKVSTSHKLLHGESDNALLQVMAITFHTTAGDATITVFHEVYNISNLLNEKPTFFVNGLPVRNFTE